MMQVDELRAALERGGVASEIAATLCIFLDESDADQAERIYGLYTSGAEAVEVWLALRALVPQTGYWPVIVGHESDQALLEDGRFELSPPEALVAASRINAEEWLCTALQQQIDIAARYENESEEDREESLKILANEIAVEGSLREIFTDVMPPMSPHFPGEEVMRSSVAEGYGKEPHTQVMIALVPTRVGADVPAYLGFGGWNGCPPPEIHVALLRRWNRIYGAEPFAISGDVIEMRLRVPPQTPHAALSLALEQYLYCSDIVEQGTESVRALAQTLYDSPYWFFWWD